MTEQQQLDKLAAEMTNIINTHFPSFMTREPNWRYFYSKNLTNKSRAKDRYFWTTEVSSYNGKKGYLSGIRRYRASKKAWLATKVVANKRRSTAKARALKLCNLEAKK